MEFKIPLKRDDLLIRDCASQYTVQEVLTVREIAEKVEECRTALGEQGVAFIIDYFDVFYSCISEHNHLDSRIKYELWSTLNEAFERLLADLDLNLSDDESLDDEMRLRLLNLLKMITYLSCQWMPLFEEETNQQNAAIVGKKGKGKSRTVLNNSEWDWNREKASFIQLIHRLCQSSYSKLWEQNVIEDAFLNLLINCCYKLLENANLNRLRDVKEAVFHILGALLKNQKNSVGHAVKIVQHLQLFEHSAIPLAQAVVIFVNSYKMNQLLNEIIREIANTTAKDTSLNNIGNRAFAAFLAEVAKQIPSLVLPNISYLATHLDGDSYNMRNCVLGIMGEILLHTKADTDVELDDRTKLLRDQFLDHLEDHLHDVHAFVRSRCLQIWVMLSENKVIPISRQQRLMELVIGRLQDKTCSVRKSAIHLLTIILKSNPFAAKISLSELEESYAKECTKLSHLIGSNDSKDAVTSSQENEDQEMSGGDQQESENVSKQRVLIHYLKDCIVFAKAVARALPMICHLLSSSQITDVVEAISFFVTSYEFGVHNSIIGIQKMLTLVWSKEVELKDAVMTAYKRLYINPDDGRGKSEIATNLIRLTQNATIGEITSLEQLIHDMVQSGDIGQPVIDALWDRFRHQVRFSDFESHAAVILIGMIASARREVIEQKLDVIVNVGLGDRAKRDIVYARDVCRTLLKLCSSKHTSDLNQKPLALPPDHKVFKGLNDIMVESIQKFDDYVWIEMAQQAIDVVYKLSDKPDIICEDILKAIAAPAIQNSDVMEQVADTMPSRWLINLLLLGGHIALRQMLHSEVTIFNELKRCRNVEEEQSLMSAVKKQRRKSRNARDSLRESVIENGDSGMNSAVAEDADAEYIRKICDKDILYGDRMLSDVAQMSVCIVSSPGKYSNVNLQTAATLALTKFMMVSQKFCEANIQLLFTVLEKSKLPATRANIMLALGDLSCRFPNTVEPWTSHIFKRVRDNSFEVRQNALAILGHLLLNDMIKVKGCVSDVALCLVDEDNKIEKMARQLFFELGQKSNAIFNLMPDIISRLLDAEVGTTEENFQTIMKYLLNFVKKDRLLESLVEKICHRFPVMMLSSQWRSLAFCLTLICESEKCYRKLLENVSTFQEQLAEEAVYRYFTDIITNARKTFKQELQVLIDELEQQIESNRKKALGEDEAITNVNRNVALGNRTVQRKARRNYSSRPEPQNETTRLRDSPSKMNAPRSLRSHRKIPVLEFSDDEFDD